MKDIRSLSPERKLIAKTSAYINNAIEDLQGYTVNNSGRFLLKRIDKNTD